MESAGDNFSLLFAREFTEINGIAGNSDSKVRIFFGVFISLNEGFAVKDINIKVMSVIKEISLKDRNEVIHAFLLGFTQCIGDDRESI